MFRDFINSLSITELVLWIVFLTVVVLQLVYWLLSYRKLLLYKSPQSKVIEGRILPPVSVIICAKNEAENLTNFLPLILQQDYPQFQVVVVNDCSDDSSEEILEQLKKKHSHLDFTTIKKDPIYRHGKKLAISLGIKASKYDHLVFTDADCIPNSKVWLQSISMHFSKEKKIVLGTSPYTPQKGLLGQVIAYETLQTAIGYISSAMRGAAYMGLGRNMAYTKELFYENKGFSGHTHLLSGDDDLFINKAATKTNVAVELSKESIMTTLPKKQWSGWFKQKKRHMTTGPLYKRKHKIRFAFEGALGFFFYALLVVLVVFNCCPLLILGVFVLRFLLKNSIYAIAAKKLNFQKSYFIQSLWLDFLVPFLRTSAFVITRIKPQKFTWR